MYFIPKVNSLQHYMQLCSGDKGDSSSCLIEEESCFNVSTGVGESCSRPGLTSKYTALRPSWSQTRRGLTKANGCTCLSILLLKYATDTWSCLNALGFSDEFNGCRMNWERSTEKSKLKLFQVKKMMLQVITWRFGKDILLVNHSN